MKTIVLDNSVSMRWCFQDGDSDYADSVLTELIDGAAAVVPPLWRIETLAVLAKAERNGAISRGASLAFLADLASLPIREDDVQPDSGSVLDLAVRLGLSGYDATYLELAKRLAVPLATLDRDLVVAASAIGVPVVESR